MILLKRNCIKLIAIITFVIVLVVVNVLVFSGCSEAMYKVDYCGQKDKYSNAQDSYKAGSEVKLCYTMVATEYSYKFYLDGERVDYEYDDATGYYVVSFVMPEHDVKLECNSRNSMEAYIE